MFSNSKHRFISNQIWFYLFFQITNKALPPYAKHYCSYPCVYNFLFQWRRGTHNIRYTIYTRRISTCFSLRDVKETVWRCRLRIPVDRLSDGKHILESKHTTNKFPLPYRCVRCFSMSGPCTDSWFGFWKKALCARLAHRIIFFWIFYTNNTTVQFYSNLHKGTCRVVHVNSVRH